ncbi:hypothetical protein [Cryptobacterium curtum]
MPDARSARTSSRAAGMRTSASVNKKTKAKITASAKTKANARATSKIGAKTGAGVASKSSTRANTGTKTVRQSSPVQSTRSRRAGLLGVKRIILVVAVVFVLVCAVIWNLWFRFDDAADIQGLWTSSDGASVFIDGHDLHLSDDVAYAYSLNTTAKTIDYTFASASGHASYRFSADRATLVLDERGGTDWLVLLGLKTDPALSGGSTSGVTVLMRKTTPLTTEITENTESTDTTESTEAAAATESTGTPDSSTGTSIHGTSVDSSSKAGSSTAKNR